MEDVFDLSKLKMFDYRELNGKTLQIRTTENEDAILASGKDIKTGNLYLLAYIRKSEVGNKV